MLTTDVLIIGAGPSGTLAAAVLQKKGYNVIVVEKMKFPRFVIGESLLPRCMDAFEKADLLDAIKAAGFQQKFGAMFERNGQVCEFDFSNKYTEGWGWTWQVPRADFDHVIAKEVESRGVNYLYEHNVNNVSFEASRVITEVSLANETFSIQSKFVIDGSGYGRVLPRLMNLAAPSNFPSRTAVFSHFKDENRSSDYSNRIQIIVIEEDIWAWVIPFSNGISSIGIVGDFDQEGRDAESILRHYIQSNDYLKSNYSQLNFLFEPRLITGYSIAVKQFYGDRFVLTGNSTEFLDPVFSSGVTFAVESAVRAAELIAKELEGEKVNWDTEYVEYIQQGVDTFRSYIKAWYNGDLQTIIFAKNFQPEIKRQICSVLAGYVWDLTNPYVHKHKRALETLAKVIAIGKRRN